METLFRRLHIQALDLRATLHFYRDILALPEQSGTPGHLRFLSPNGVEIVFMGSDEVSGGSLPLGQCLAEFEVGDLDAVVGKLREAGSYFVLEPGAAAAEDGHAIVLDPNGFQVLLRQRAG